MIRYYIFAVETTKFTTELEALNKDMAAEMVKENQFDTMTHSSTELSFKIFTEEELQQMILNHSQVRMEN